MKSSEIVERAKSLGGCVYWYGAKRQKCTQTLADALQRQNPKVWTDSYMEKAKTDIKATRTACDCSGLVCYAYDIGDIGSGQIRQKYAGWNGTPKPGMIAWKAGHVGIIVDTAGHMAEMRGIDYDYQENRTWKEAGMTAILYDSAVNYDNDAAAGWYKDDSGWWYRHTEGTGAATYYHDGYYWVDGHKYYFDSSGYICTMQRVSPESETGWIV